MTNSLTHDWCAIVSTGLLGRGKSIPSCRPNWTYDSHLGNCHEGETCPPLDDTNSSGLDADFTEAWTCSLTAP